MPKKKIDYEIFKNNIDYKVFQFRQASQLSGETVDQFVTHLRKLAAHVRSLPSSCEEFADIIRSSKQLPEPNMLFKNRLCFLEMLNFLPIILKIMPDYASKFCKRVYIIEQEMTILSFTRNKK